MKKKAMRHITVYVMTFHMEENYCQTEMKFDNQFSLNQNQAQISCKQTNKNQTCKMYTHN